jgi:Flp pilus assembly protein TadG
MIRRLPFRRLRSLAASTRALAAVEFAMAAPFMILLYVGGAQLTDAISAYRKVVQADHTLADVTTQYVSMSTTDLNNIMSGARQVMAPYPTDNVTMIIAQIKFNPAGKAKVDWYLSSDGTKLKNKDLSVPTDIVQPNGYIVYSQITYNYVPRIAASLIGPITFTDHLYMNARRSTSVNCTDC